MIDAQNMKFVGITPPGPIIDNASATTTSVDTAGWHYLHVCVYFGAMDIAATACKLQYSDTDGSYTDIPGMVFGTSTDISGSTSSLPSATDDNKGFAFFLDLRGKKRYVDLVLTLGDGSAGTYVTAIGFLSRGDNVGTTAAALGYANALRA